MLVIKVILSILVAWVTSWIISSFVLGDPNLSDGSIPSAFMVIASECELVIEPNSASFAHCSRQRIVFLRDLANKTNISFYVTDTSGKNVPDNDGVSFKILEQTPTHQLVEVHFRNSWSSSSRYKVEDNGKKIVPISYTHNGALLIPLYLLFGLIIASAVGRIIKKQLRVLKLHRSGFSLTLSD